MAQSVLLEPWYQLRLELPQEQVGRAMSDVQRMGGSLELSETTGDQCVLTGSAPVSQARDYALELAAYPRGQGRLFCTLDGYRPCPDQQAVVDAIG